MLKTINSEVYVYNDKKRFEKVVSYEVNQENSVLIKINNKYYKRDSVELYRKEHNRLHLLNGEPLKILNSF